MSVIFLLGAALVFLTYFAPTLLAMTYRKQDVMAVFALNLFLGWTFFGWVVALVWSLKGAGNG